MKDFKIAMVIKTSGLEYDDRVRKEILTVQKMYSNVFFQIFVMLDNDNRAYEGVTSYGTPFKTVYLKSRDKFPSATHLLEKSYEFFRVIKNDLKAYDAIWCADRHCFMVAALAKSKRILWDLHELPYEFFSNKPMRWFLRYILKRCKVVVHANPQRLEYMKSLGLINQPEKHFAIRNYPNFDEIDPVEDEQLKRFDAWKSDRKCVYLQGLNNDGRAAYESVTAVMRTEPLAAVVVGGFDDASKERLREAWGDALEQRIFFAGKIPQLKIPQYVSRCYSSMVFYKNIRPNNYYCEANRFYQSVIMGLPVVVGDNPPMRELVTKYGFGLSIDDDGRDMDKICSALTDIMTNYDKYQANIIKYRHLLFWDTQEPEFTKIIDRLLEV